MKYKVLKMFTYEGRRCNGGDVIELSKEQSKAFAPGFIEPLEPIRVKSKSTITKKTK
jgi:hypothetical protein